MNEAPPIRCCPICFTPEGQSHLSPLCTKTGSNLKQFGGTHYKKLAIEPWDYAIANDMPFMEGSVVKYVTRWRDKAGIEDLKKARHYLDKLIEIETAKGKKVPDEYAAAG